MTPDQIHSFIQSHYPQLIADARNNPDGWSFFLGHPQRGPNSNRILRAVAHGADTQLKLAVSSRLSGQPVESTFAGTESELAELIDRELQRYQESQSQPKG